MTAQNGQKIFAAGRFYGIPTVTNPTPSPLSLAQDISIDFKRDIKRLYGLNQLPADIASGTLSVVGKVTNGVVSARSFNDLMIGGTLSTGQTPWIAAETGTVAGTSLGVGSFTVVNGAGFATDLGLYNVVTGIPYTRVSTGLVTSTMTYSVSTAGVYSVSSLEGNVGFKASYTYSTSNGQTVSMTNQPMGKIGNFQAVAAFLWGTDKATFQFNNCMASDFNLASKLDDYMKPGFGFEAACDTTDTLGSVSYAELS